MKDGRRKGKDFELKISKALSEWSGIPLRRTPMSGGWSVGAADLCCADGTDFQYAVECKNAEGWDFHQIMQGVGRFYNWLDQAIDQGDCTFRKPILIFSRNYKPTYVCVRAKHVKGLMAAPYSVVRIYHDGVSYFIMTLDAFLMCVPYGF